MPSAENQNTSTPKHVIILGGGPAGVSAAYWLSHPVQKGQYKVSLYTQGWRLGGKCASGRNAELGNRIEEHGLHMLMGCYHNGFATVRSCYLDWREIKTDPANPFQIWTDAFTPLRQVTLMSQDGPGEPPSWLPWNIPFLIQIPGQPGDGPLVKGSDQTIPLTDGERLILWAGNWMERFIPDVVPFLESVNTAFGHLRDVFDGVTTTTEPARSALHFAADEILKILDGSHPEFAAVLETLESLTLRRLAILAKLGVTIAIGYLTDIYDKGPEAWDAIDVIDFREWLHVHGAGEDVLASAPVAAFYDLAFGSISGMSPGLGGGSIAAGSALRAQLEMVLGYRNAPLFKMNAGMGDTVFTPFYDVLTARGVEINFFSRVTEMRADGDIVSEVDIMVQAETVDGLPYRPLTRVLNLDCWPNQPDWSQLKNGAQLQQDEADFELSFCKISAGPPLKLKSGEDFDIAILAIPPELDQTHSRTRDRPEPGLVGGAGCIGLGLHPIAPALDEARSRWPWMGLWHDCTNLV